MWVFDCDTLGFLAVNRAAVERYGWSRQEFRRMTLADIRPPEEQALLDAVLARADLGSSPTPYQMRHRTRDGALIDVEITMRGLDFGGRSAGVVLAQDVTERTRAAQARQAMEERLRQAQKMEAVGQMTGGIAHDFNNLLGVIIMKMEMMQEDLPPGSPFAATVAGALGAALRGAELVKRLLAFSRRRELNAVKTDIAELLEGVEPLIKAAVPQVHLRIEPQPALRACMVDRTGLETALLNLSVNARDAMPPGGTLRITARNRTIDDAEAASRAGLVAGDWIEIAVGDTGSGIPPEVLSQIFEPFFTTKAEGKGTGLGLSMVLGFITQSGGFVVVDSVVGQGTTFRLHLPVIY
jgi:PAS domain S-box-containing protein